MTNDIAKELRTTPPSQALNLRAADEIDRIERALVEARADSRAWIIANIIITQERDIARGERAAEKALADSYADGFRIGKSGGVIMRPAQVKAANAAYRKARGL